MQAARDAHPDKGGDKQTFQDINNAYEKIMLQRKQSIHTILRFIDYSTTRHSRFFQIASNHM